MLCGRVRKRIPMKRLLITLLLLFVMTPFGSADDRFKGHARARDGVPPDSPQRPSPAALGKRADGTSHRPAPRRYHRDNYTYNACDGYQQQYWQQTIMLQQWAAQPPVFIWKPMGTQGDPEKKKWYDDAVKRQQGRTGYIPSQPPSAAGETADELNVFPGRPVTDSFGER